MLFEMIEVYRDRLKLDVMVVNAFNQILTIQPDNIEAADALARSTRPMKRWPDLISLLRKKAAVVETPAEKVGAAPAGRQPVPGEVLEPGRGHQVVRDDPRAGSRQRARRSAFLKQMYEKRRDWEKLIAVHQREIEQARRRRRAQQPAASRSRSSPPRS